MKIPDYKKEPWTYNRWKEMDLLNASDIERVLMLKLDSLATAHEYLHGDKWWDRDDMREFVRHVAQKIEEVLIKNEQHTKS